MNRFISFDEFITPNLIQLLFFFMVFANFIAAIGVIFDIGGFMGVVGGIFYLFLSVVMSRVFCEMLIVVFKINENLKAIHENISAKNPKIN